MPHHEAQAEPQPEQPNVLTLNLTDREIKHLNEQAVQENVTLGEYLKARVEGIVEGIEGWHGVVGTQGWVKRLDDASPHPLDKGHVPQVPTTPISVELDQPTMDRLATKAQIMHYQSASRLAELTLALSLDVDSVLAMIQTLHTRPLDES